MLYFLLFLSGFVASIINTLAGAGSIIPITFMIFLGVPSVMANATNRLPIIMQNAVGTYQLSKKYEKVKYEKKIIFSAIIGSIIGSFIAIEVPDKVFDIVFSLVIIFVLCTFFFPKNNELTKNKNIPNFVKVILFFFIGIYGGFIQVGVGFLLLGTFKLLGQKDLISANNYKLFISLCYLPLSFLIYAISGQIIWKYALVITLGNMLGAYVSCNLAIKKGTKFVKFILVIAVIISLLKLFKVF